MKYLILTIGILVTGVINAQSFSTAKELSVALYARLEFLGFEKAVEKDSIIFKMWNFNEAADVWVNNTTGEKVKVSPTATEYIYNDTVMIQKRKNLTVNISYALLSSIGARWNDSPLLKRLDLIPEEMEVSSAGSLYKKFKRFYLSRNLKTDSASNSSFVVFL